MRLELLVVAYPAWLGGSLTRGQRSGLERVGKPRTRGDVPLSTIALRRVAVGLTRQAVADRLGVGLDAVKRVERRLPHTRGDVRSVALRRRMSGLYRSIETGKVRA